MNSAVWGIVDVWNYIEESIHLDWYRGGDQMIGNQIRETGCGLNRWSVSMFVLKLSFMSPDRLLSDL